MNFIPNHAVAAVGIRLDRSGDRVVEARPTGAAFELELGREQRLIASGANTKVSSPAMLF